MLEPKDLQQLSLIVEEAIEKKLADVLEITNQGFSDMQKSFGDVNQRVDKLYSLIDSFILSSGLIPRSSAATPFSSLRATT